MRRSIFLLALFASLLATCPALAQSKRISTQPKITKPYITEAGDTLKVGTAIQIMDTSGDSDKYKYVQLLNNFNEPCQPATTRFALKKDAIVFFKEDDGVVYAFTKFFCFNAELALFRKEVRIIEK